MDPSQVYQQQSKGPYKETASYPCRGRLGNTIVGHVLSKRGAENPEDVLGAFFGEAYLHREIKCSSGGEQGHGQSCQEKCWVRRSGRLQGRRRELHQQSFKA